MPKLIYFFYRFTGFREFRTFQLFTLCINISEYMCKTEYNFEIVLFNFEISFRFR